MTSRSWQYISCHWDACSSHLAISDSCFYTYTKTKHSLNNELRGSNKWEHSSSIPVQVSYLTYFVNVCMSTTGMYCDEQEQIPVNRSANKCHWINLYCSGYADKNMHLHVLFSFEYCVGILPLMKTYLYSHPPHFIIHVYPVDLRSV